MSTQRYYLRILYEMMIKGRITVETAVAFLITTTAGDLLFMQTSFDLYKIVVFVILCLFYLVVFVTKKKEARSDQVVSYGKENLRKLFTGLMDKLESKQDEYSKITEMLEQKMKLLDAKLRVYDNKVKTEDQRINFKREGE